jgi:hypothetical protein
VHVARLVGVAAAGEQLAQLAGALQERDRVREELAAGGGKLGRGAPAAARLVNGGARGGGPRRSPGSVITRIPAERRRLPCPATSTTAATWSVEREGREEGIAGMVTRFR